MKPPSIRTAVALLFASSVILALPLAGANAAIARPSPSPVYRFPNVTFGSSPLSKAEILRLAQNANRHVIVVLRNQFRQDSGRAQRMLSTRNAAIADLQRPIINQLHSVHARHLLAFHLINAIRATVSTAEIARLRADPAVEAVAPDSVIRAPRLSRPDLPTARFARRAAYVAKCAYSKPILQPEALGLTNTAFQNGRTPQAQNLVTGKGVTVAIVSGPIDPYNSDFRRTDGHPVITDYENFSGDPNSLPNPGWAAESFIDMSSVASQGNDTFNLNDYVAGALGNNCTNVKILGMAPGANVMWLDVANAVGGTNSTFIQGIQYAVDNGANVISQSFGGNPASDTGVDVIIMADEQAVADGLTVATSSGDAGPGGSIGSPATAPGVISVGATTSEQFRVLLGEFRGTPFKSYIENNVAPFSSSGATQTGQKTVDVVAPGAFGIQDCTPNPVQFPNCTNMAGQPSPIEIFGGTSESAPFVAGEAALVIEAFEKTHGGQVPTSGEVKQIVMSTATDLHDPSAEQGAGLINSLKAVQAAESLGAASPQGDALLTSPADLTATGVAGAGVSLPFTVTNDGAATQTVTPSARALGTPATQSFAVKVNPKTTPTAVKTFNVAAHTDHLAVDISWDVVKQPFSGVFLRLIDPKGRYADHTDASDNGSPFTSSGYGHIDIARPTAGTWTAQVTNAPGLTPYTGAVDVNVNTSDYVTLSTVKPATASVAPGKTATFHLATTMPQTPGDFNADLTINASGPSGGVQSGTGTIPVILRTLVPTTAAGGAFAGTLTGGNGRFGALYSQTFAFNVPTGQSNLALGITTGSTADNLEGVLVNPQGWATDIQSTVTAIDLKANSPTAGMPTQYTNGMQFFQRDPAPGQWRFELIINNNVSGANPVHSFSGAIAFNTVGVTASGLPGGASSQIAAGKTVAATVTIKNTGNTTKSYFVDPRLNTVVGLEEGTTVLVPLSSPPYDRTPAFLIPPETSDVIMAAESIGSSKSPTQPIQFDAQNNNGAPPYGSGADPDLESTPSFNAATGNFAASAEFKAPEIPWGLYNVNPSEIGPYANGAPETMVATGMLIATQQFNTDAAASTGDLWTSLVGLSSAPYKPLILAPGATGTIKVAITPTSAPGTTAAGNLYVDTFAASQGFPSANPSAAITWSGDEVAALPYNYTVK